MGDERRHEAFGAWEPFHEKVAMSLPCRRTVTKVRETDGKARETHTPQGLMCNECRVRANVMLSPRRGHLKMPAAEPSPSASTD